MVVARRSRRLMVTRLLLPDIERRGPHLSIVVGRHQVARWMEMAIDERVSGQELLRLIGRLEALHLALSAAGWPMRVLRSIIEVSALPVFDIG